MKASFRIQQLDSMITQHYDHIWDCCCDHGQLGLRLLARGAANTIHFVDIVQPLMDELEEKLLQHDREASDAHWQVHCMDVAKLRFSSDETHLVIISGVGGELIIDFITAILASNPLAKLEFILCPVHHNYQLRCALGTEEFGLVAERLIKENNRFYEALHISTSAQKPIALVGSEMWDLTRQDDQDYLQKTLAHYRRVAKSKPGMDDIIRSYEVLLLA